MRIWKWFAAIKDTEGLGGLANMLDVLWQEERKNSTPEEVAAHAAALAVEDTSLVNDPDYQAFEREMDRATEEIQSRKG
jgi:hypothetical protein